MSSYLMLQSEEERLAEVQKVNERAEQNIPLLQQHLVEVILDHETIIKKRDEYFKELAAALSA